MLVPVALLIPWLNPFAGGPSPAVTPWLVSAFCAAFVCLLHARLTARSVAVSWLLAAVLSALMGLLQYFGLTQGLTPWLHAASLGEAFANLRQRNQFATLTSIGLLALLWHVAQWRLPVQEDTGETDNRGYGILAGYALVLPLALGNAASGSRTGLLQWLLVTALTLLWRPRSQWRLVGLSVAALAMYLLAVLALPLLLEWATGQAGGGLMKRMTEDMGCSSRRVMWANVLHLIAQKPWWGWGWGELDYAHFITPYPGERFCEILDNAHNLPLHLAVELGVPLSLAVCGGGLWLVWHAQPWRERDTTRQLAWGVLVVILLHSLLEYPLWYGPFQIAFGLSVWLLTAGGRTATPALQQIMPKAGARQMLVAALLMAPIAYAAWDYHRISQIYLDPEVRDAVYRDNTLGKLKSSRLFADQVNFAELTTTPVEPENAARLNAMAHQVLHYSPEARVVEKLVESATMLGRDDEALSYVQRFKIAYPQEYERWSKGYASDDAD